MVQHISHGTQKILNGDILINSFLRKKTVYIPPCKVHPPLYWTMKPDVFNVCTGQFHDKWTNDVNPHFSDLNAIWCKGLLGPVKLVIQMADLYDQ